VALWFGTSLVKDIQRPPLITLGYQLFSALAGTLADAKLDGSELAVVLVQEYVTDLTEDAKHELNRRTLDEFLERLLGADVPRRGDRTAWITEPRPVHGDGKTMVDVIPVAFAKLTHDLRSSPR
jgi:hypothetical protein